jgi:tetratricopeptide (TPR) repeat protein
VSTPGDSATPPPDIDALWDFSDPAATEGKFCALLARAVPARDVSLRLQVLTQIARTQGLRDQFDAAHATLDEVEKELGGDDAVQVVPRLRHLLERGRVFNSAGQAERARPLFERAWELGRETGHDRYAIDAAHMMGIAGETAESRIEWSHKAMAAAEASADGRARRWLGPLYNNLGWTYHDRGDYGDALEMFEKGLEFRAQRPEEAEPLRIARWSVARALRSLGRHEEALAMQQKLLSEYVIAGKTSGPLFEEIGENLVALGQADGAREWFAKAYPELVREGWDKWEPERVRRVRQLAGLGE